ncbi:copper ABC transporter permease [Halorubrum coriense DSM 10284]|uniref:Copper ABC transporter permease n=1 Tax=Halorubrum coriense DSM 10284 TaxID=1227466 RepID=M0E5Z4_9EURY|nr:ABC transporter permease subunit [Halorubrum coriense]ELZ43191.1 copper ABC transporter permease [Halorubrum coriense DSM 10284]
MSVRTVARKDLADAGRSKALWAVTLAVVLFTAGITAAAAVTVGEPAAVLFGQVFQIITVALPIIALFVAKGAITGERESGSLRVLLSLPPSRRDILIGKLIGRMALMVIATLIGAVATGFVMITLLGDGLALLVPFMLFLALMGMAFVGIGVGISASSASDGRATAFAVGAYLVLVAMWSLIFRVIQVGAVELGLIEAGSQPAWLQFISLFPPNRAASAAFEAVRSGGQIFATDPFASVWFPTLILLAWIVVPALGGYLRFRDADIG